VIFQFALLEQLSKMQLHIGQIHHISFQLTQVGKRNIFPEVCLVFPPLKFLLTLKILKKPVNMVQGGGYSFQLHSSYINIQNPVFNIHLSHLKLTELAGLSACEFLARSVGLFPMVYQ
jgi:hypothetical protein